MIARLLGAIEYLTIIPVRRKTAEPGQSALFFPFVGAALGALGGLALDAFQGYVPFMIVALLVLAFWTLVTGGLHEDAVADSADAFRSWRSPETIHEILKDSRVGAHGASALILLTLIRWQALSAIAAPAIPALAAALGIGRAAVVALAWISPPAGSGGGLCFANTLTTAVALIAIAQGIALAVLTGSPTASILLGGATCIVLLARKYFQARIGGVTGDCLGVTEQLVETWCFLVFTCQPCTS